jgi:hypothetical protein
MTLEGSVSPVRYRFDMRIINFMYEIDGTLRCFERPSL